MAFDDHFVALNRGCMIDPVLRIAVRETRFDLEDSTHWFDVDYDPNLRPGRLWQKLEPATLNLLIAHQMTRPKDDLAPFRSTDNLSLFSLGINEKPVADELVLTLNWRARDLDLYRRLTAEKVPSLAGSANDILAYLIRSLPKWYADKQKTPCGWKDMKRMTFLVDKSVMRLLANPLHVFEECSPECVMFDQREIA